MENNYVFICYSKCSTCQKAKKYLVEHNIVFKERDIKISNPTKEELRLWYKLSGLPLKKFFNTSGLVYKTLKLKEKLPTMSEEEMLDVLSSDGMLVKRPLLIGEEKVLVGFSEIDYAKLNN